MAEGNAFDRRGGFSRNYPRSLEIEILNLHALHTANAESLRGAFSQPVVEILRQLSEEEFFQQPDSESAHPSSYYADISGDDTLASSLASTPEENWQTTRNLFEFIYSEFMPAPKEEQMGKFQKFLDRILETAHRLKLPDGSSFNPEENPKVHQCLLAIRTMRQVIITKFQSLKKFKREGPGPAASPGAGIGNFSGDASTSNPSRGARQNAPERNETIFESLPPRNPEAIRVITENPMHAAIRSQLPGPSQQTRPSVVQTNPAHPSSHGASGVDQEDRSTSSPPRKRPPLRRQSHVPEND